MDDKDKEQEAAMSPPVVLCFSGHDPVGGAGIQADIETLASLGCHASTVVTTLTVQDTHNVQQLTAMDAMGLVSQARAVLEDLPVKAVKIGLLGSAEIAQAIHSILVDYPDLPVVIDPVLVAGGGSSLSDEKLLSVLRALLLPQATVLTPNHPELLQLALEADCPQSAAHELMEIGCDYILATGTHADTDQVVNTLWGFQRQIHECQWPRLAQEYHGSGCTLASAVAGFLAHGMTPESAARDAQNYTWNSLKHGRRIGMGQWLPDRLFWASQGSGNLWEKGN